MQELIQIIAPVLIAIGYMRGRLNGLVDMVEGFKEERADLEKRINELEDYVVKCEARREAEEE